MFRKSTVSPSFTLHSEILADPRKEHTGVTPTSLPPLGPTLMEVARPLTLTLVILLSSLEEKQNGVIPAQYMTNAQMTVTMTNSRLQADVRRVPPSREHVSDLYSVCIIGPSCVSA